MTTLTHTHEGGREGRGGGGPRLLRLSHANNEISMEKRGEEEDLRGVGEKRYEQWAGIVSLNVLPGRSLSLALMAGAACECGARTRLYERAYVSPDQSSIIATLERKRRTFAEAKKVKRMHFLHMATFSFGLQSS